MIITSISKGAYISFSLPQKVAGQYWIFDASEEHPKKLASIEGVGENWVLKSNRQVKVLDNNDAVVRSRVIEPQAIYSLLKDDGKRAFVYTEPSTEDRLVFTKHLVGTDITISIGRDDGNAVCYKENTVSARHALLSCIGGQWSIEDAGSSNGTFVNGRSVSATLLSIGDLVYIMGLKIIVGKGFFAVNNPDGKVVVADSLTRFTSQRDTHDEDDEFELPEADCFYRSPRFKRDVTKEEFTIDAPPNSPIGDEMPWPLVMGSSMAMGMMSTVTLVSAIITHNVTSMVMGGSMMLGTLLLPIITKIYDKKRKRNKEAKRQVKYREYLERMAVQIGEACHVQETIMKENVVPIQDCEDRIKEVRRDLWDRSLGQNDFLCMRVGHGRSLLNADISCPEKHFSLDDDNLLEEATMRFSQPFTLNDVPISYSLLDEYVSGIIGSRRQVIGFAQGMIIQTAALYSSEEVKLVFLYDEEEKKDFDFVKWLPHVWNDDRRFRFLATNFNETKEISAYLEDLIDHRVELSDADMDEETPYYIVFSLSKRLAAHCEMIRKVLEAKKNLHISIVTVYEELKNLPKECSMVVEIDGNRGRLFDRNDISGKYVEFVPDIFLSNDPRDLSVRLANVSVDSASGNYVLPKTITFLELFGVGKVEHLNSLTRWKENNPTKTLEAPVGIDTLGEIFKLDLHEKFHGPHGLVAGMTGSGKSEFIITYILSLAVNYHPDEVAFILIDYKGGGMAKSFEKLPHTAGIITNLDGAAIKRSLVSIESELKRRQAIFAETSKRVGVSNIDIYKYQKLYREGKVTEPLQHLFMISDEFAELKTQRPEFMTQLVSAARIGRSLGVHLILATQKPSGVVDDQIWSNSKFRVCLKVQERADSMDMLKRPEAAELTDAGRFYLQVGYNELFELGQSAWAGAPYYPSDQVQKEKDDSVVVIDTNGHPIREMKMNRKKAFGDAPKQLDVITEYLRKIAEDENIKVRPLWLDPIPEIILLDKIGEKYDAQSEKYVLNPVIGEYDNPAHQRQDILRLPISAEGNVVIYGAAGSGKTSFLNAMIFSLLKEHTPEEVNLYILDFASETLRAFSKAPHVGDVMLSYEAEKINNLFKMLNDEIEYRKKLFADYGGDYSAYISLSGQYLPSIVVVINNYAALTEMYDKEDIITILSREGTKYGIYFVLTALGVNSVRFRLLQNFKQLFVLQLNDEADYSTVVGKTEGLFPSKIKGRGLVRKEELVEFQVASLIESGALNPFIQSECEHMRTEWKGETAPPVPVLPDVVNAEYMSRYTLSVSEMRVPIGVEKNTLRVHYYPFGDCYVNLIVSALEEYQSFLKELCILLGQNGNARAVMLDPLGSFPGELGGVKVISRQKEIEGAVSDLFEETRTRNNTYKEAVEKGESCPTFEPLIVLINSITALEDAIRDKEGQEKLGLILLKGSRNYNMTVIIGDQMRNVDSVSYREWFKPNVSGQNCIWVGSGITEQYKFKVNKVTAEMREEVEPGYAYSVIRGRAKKIKALREMVDEVAEDE